MNCSFNVRSYINVQLNTLIFENFLWDRNDQFKRSILLVICKGTRFFGTCNPSRRFFYRLFSFLSIGQVILHETSDSFNEPPVSTLKKRKIQTIVQTSRFYRQTAILNQSNRLIILINTSININLFIMNHSWHLTLKVNQDVNQQFLNRIRF